MKHLLLAAAVAFGLGVAGAGTTAIVSAQACNGSCPTAPPSNVAPPTSTGPAGSQNNNTALSVTPQNAQQTNAQAYANPLGQNTNIQNNYQSNSQVGMGLGFQCPTTSIAASAYQANSSASGFPGTNLFGTQVGVVIPINQRGTLDACTRYGRVIADREEANNVIGYARNCADLAHSGIDIHRGDIAKYCANVYLVAAPPAPVPVATPTPMPMRQIHLSNFTPMGCVRRPQSDILKLLGLVHSYRHELQTNQPGPELIDAVNQLQKTCGVSAQQIIHAEDGTN